MLSALGLLVAWGALGSGIARSAAEPDTEPLETAVRAAVATFAAWLACSWSLAFGRALSSATVIGAACVAAGGAVVLHRRANRRASVEVVVPGVALVAALPIGLWIVYAVSRAMVVPVGNHDAISYHFPRAVFFVLDHGYRFHAEVGDTRLSTFPANYELLIANILTAHGSDSGTVLVELFAFVSFGLLGASLARRWWSGPAPALLAFVLTCATPLVVLHSAAYKNDVLFSFFAAAATQWIVRFALEAKRRDAVWGICAVGLALGTKSHGALLAAVLAPFVVAGLWRARDRSTAAAVALSAIASAVGLGGVVIAVNVVKTGGLGLGVYDFHNAGGPFYSDWHNLWRFPLVMLAAPFTSEGPSPDSIWVYWSSERYWWSESNLYFGHYGAAFTLAALAIPIVERWAPRERRRERCLMLVVPIVVACVILPTRVRPYGFFLQQARYSLAIVPIVLAWGCGAVEGVAARLPGRRGLLIVAVLASAWFARNAWRMGERDDYQPFRFVADAAFQESPIREPFVNRGHRRVGYLVDRVAGPNDIVAVDDDIDTWLYPMFGADHRRPVRFVSIGADGRAIIPEGATWVAIDRGQQEVFFTHPDFTDFRLSLMSRCWGRGRLAEANLVTLRQLEADPAFELAYLDRAGNQALFRRKAPPP